MEGEGRGEGRRCCWMPGAGRRLLLGVALRSGGQQIAGWMLSFKLIVRCEAE